MGGRVGSQMNCEDSRLCPLFMNGRVFINTYTSHATIVDCAYASVPRMSHTYWGSVRHRPSYNRLPRVPTAFLAGAERARARDALFRGPMGGNTTGATAAGGAAAPGTGLLGSSSWLCLKSWSSLSSFSKSGSMPSSESSDSELDTDCDFFFLLARTASDA